MQDVDALAWVMGSDGATGDQVEVHQVWGDLVVDVRQVPADGRVVVGSTQAWRWRLLGVDMGGIPASAARMLPWVLPLWSDVTSASGADFTVPSDDLPGGMDHVLVEGGLVRIAAGFGGFVDLDGERLAFADVPGAVEVDGGLAFPLLPGARVVVEVAGQVFHLRRSAPEKRASARLFADPGVLGLGGMALALLACVVTVGSGPPPTGATVAELPEPVEAIAIAPPTVITLAARDPAPDTHAAPGPKTASKRQSKRPASDRDVAGNAGLLSASLDALGGAGLSSELRAGVGGLIGARGGPQGGGLGRRGEGLGGTGEAEGGPSIGLHGPGGGGGPLTGKSQGEISTSTRDVMLVGNVDKSAIDAVIKRNIASIRYCYQRELQRRPGLGGKLVVKFTIARDGTVSSAATKSSTLGGDEVEQCVIRRFAGMKFPVPAGGGIAIVSYPFLFSAD